MKKKMVSVGLSFLFFLSLLPASQLNERGVRDRKRQLMRLVECSIVPKKAQCSIEELIQAKKWRKKVTFRAAMAGLVSLGIILSAGTIKELRNAFHQTQYESLQELIREGGMPFVNITASMRNQIEKEIETLNTTKEELQLEKNALERELSAARQAQDRVRESSLQENITFLKKQMDDLVSKINVKKEMLRMPVK